MGSARAVLVALALAGSAQAAEVTPAMVWNGPAPSGACLGSRVVSLAGTGALYCCQTGTWTACGTVGGGGAGLPADPAACPASQWAYDQNASGVLSCSQPGWTDIASKPATFAPAPHTHPGTDVTSQVASAAAAPWSGLTGVPATFTPSAHTHPGSDVTSAVANATAAAGLSGTTGTPSSSTFLRGDWTWQAPPGGALPAGSGSEIQTRATASTFAAYGGSGTCAASNWMTALDASGAKTCTRPAFSDVSGSVASGQLPGATGAAQGAIVLTGDLGGTSSSPTVPGLASKAPSTTGTAMLKGDGAGGFAAAVAGDLPGGPYLTSVTAHTLMGATHSDVDTAATTGGDLVVRNSGNTQWTHQAAGTATQVLHGGTNVVTWGAVDLSADTAATLLPSAKGGTGNGFWAVSGPASTTKTWTVPNASLTIPTPVAGAVMYGSSTSAWAMTANPTTNQALFGVAGGTPVWADSDKVVRLTSDYTNATTAMTNTALTWTSPAQVSRSAFDCTLIVKVSVATIGAQIDVNVSTAPTTIAYTMEWLTAYGTPPGAATFAKGFSNTSGTALGPTTMPDTNYGLWRLSGVIVHTSTSATATVRAKATNTGTITIGSGSACQFYVL